MFFCLMVPDASLAQVRKPGKEESLGLQVYPNPSSGKFTLQVKEQERGFHINIYNLIGEMVYHWESGVNTFATFEVDLSRRPDGVYFVELDTEKANVLQRIIIDRN
jgi:hypothetical protein